MKDFVGTLCDSMNHHVMDDNHDGVFFLKVELLGRVVELSLNTVFYVFFMRMWLWSDHSPM